MHRVDLIKKVSDSPASTNDGTEAGHITADGDIIPQDSNSVKRNFSDRSSDGSLLFIKHFIGNVTKQIFAIDKRNGLRYTIRDRAMEIVGLC